MRTGSLGALGSRPRGAGGSFSLGIAGNGSNLIEDELADSFLAGTTRDGRLTASIMLREDNMQRSS
jgi:hypothetical protein